MPIGELCIAVMIGGQLSPELIADIKLVTASLGELGKLTSDISTMIISLPFQGIGGAFLDAPKNALDFDGIITSMGVNCDAIKPQITRISEGVNLSEPFALAAKVANAPKAELANLAGNMANIINLPLHQVTNEFDRLMKAGKAGNFDFSTLVQVAPSLLPAIDGLAIKGSDDVKSFAEVNQTIRQMSGDDTQTAANLQNAVSTMLPRDTMNMFSQFGQAISKNLSGMKLPDLQVPEGVQGLMNKLKGLGDLSQKKGDKSTPPLHRLSTPAFSMTTLGIGTITGKLAAATSSMAAGDLRPSERAAALGHTALQAVSGFASNIPGLGATVSRIQQAVNISTELVSGKSAGQWLGDGRNLLNNKAAFITNPLGNVADKADSAWKIDGKGLRDNYRDIVKDQSKLDAGGTINIVVKSKDVNVVASAISNHNDIDFAVYSGIAPVM